MEALEPYSPYLRGAPLGLPFSLDEQTVKNGLNFRLTTTLGDLDLFGEMAGVGPYNELLPNSDEVQALGVTFLCVGLDRLIHMKRAARRPKDLEAIAELRVILEEEQHAASKTESMARDYGQILKDAIENQSVLRFLYNGQARVVEPRTYGISTSGNEVLRGYQREGGSASGTAARLKLFELAKISKLEMTGDRFASARPEHNPNDSAMIAVGASPSMKVGVSSELAAVVAGGGFSVRAVLGIDKANAKRRPVSCIRMDAAACPSGRTGKADRNGCCLAPGNWRKDSDGTRGPTSGDAAREIERVIPANDEPAPELLASAGDLQLILFAGYA